MGGGVSYRTCGGGQITRTGEHVFQLKNNVGEKKRMKLTFV
jgi:hypothetical protein